jgi:hypothetical protein
VASSVSLPQTADPAYASLGTLGRHVLFAAAGYMIWMCEVLALPDPGIHSAPDAAAILREAEDYMDPVLERWRAGSGKCPTRDWRLPSTPRDGRRATASTRCWSML